MESITYVCYNRDDLATQLKTYSNEVQNMKAALLKVAENDVNAGTLEEIKALLGMDANVDASAPTSASAPSSDAKEPVSEPSATENSATDTKEPETTVSAPSVASEPGTVTVQPGDTLQTLAEKTGATPRHLIEANMLMEPVVLRPGQSLKY